MAVKSLLRCALIGAGLVAASPGHAVDLALVVTGDDALTSETAHEELIQSYTAAGFEVISASGLDRERLAERIAQFERAMVDTDRLVVHLSGPLVSEAGLSVFLPENVAAESRTEVLTGGIPLPLLFEIAATRPGQSMVALGVTRLADPMALQLEIPQGVLVLRGRPIKVRDVIVDQMLGAGRTALEIDATAAEVQFEGLVTNLFRLADPVEEEEVASVSEDPGPEVFEADLALSEEDRIKVQDDLRILGYDTGAADGTFGEGTRAALRNWQRDNGMTVTGYLNRRHYGQLNAAAAAERAEIAEAEAANIATSEAERAGWDLARSADTLRAYRSYLETYPEGRFADRARDRIETLEAASETAQRIRGYRQEERSLGLTVASVAVLERRLDSLGLVAGPPDGRVDRQTRRALATFQAQRGLTPTGYLNPQTIQRLILAGNESSE
ncbi:MAG: peptidoglycan-binding domain-containing protein [Pseudomonadota bacterium]